MRTLLGLLPTAACVGGMFVCIRMMSRGHRARGDASVPGQPGAVASAEELVALQEEVRRLRVDAEARDPKPF